MRAISDGVQADHATAPARRRVLIAEDNEDLRLMLAALIDGADGLQCVAQTGRLADVDAMIREYAVEVAVLDVELGRESAVAALPRLRRAHPQTYFLMHSGHPHPELIQGAQRAGASGYVLKSGDPEELMERIRRVGRD